MNKVVHFELPYRDAKRISDFYEKSFSWKIAPANIEGVDYHMAISGPTDEN